MGMRIYKDWNEVKLRLGYTFAFLEDMVKAGKISSYGISAS
jgi:hypothetical protein